MLCVSLGGEGDGTTGSKTTCGSENGVLNVDLQVRSSCMLAWEIWPFLQAASGIGVLKKAYLLIEP